jgi:hypothetical protein
MAVFGSGKGGAIASPFSNSSTGHGSGPSSELMNQLASAFGLDPSTDLPTLAETFLLTDEEITSTELPQINSRSLMGRLIRLGSRLAKSKQINPTDALALVRSVTRANKTRRLASGKGLDYSSAMTLGILSGDATFLENMDSETAQKLATRIRMSIKTLPNTVQNILETMIS